MKDNFKIGWKPVCHGEYTSHISKPGKEQSCRECPFKEACEKKDKEDSEAYWRLKKEEGLDIWGY